MAVPLAVAVLETKYPPHYTADVFGGILPVADSWIVLQAGRIVLFGLLALAVYLLTEGTAGWAALTSRLFAGVFLVSFTVLNAISGLAVGTLIRNARHMPPDQQAVVARIIQKLFFDYLVGGSISVIAALWIIAWFSALISAAGALYRDGAPALPVLLLITAAVLFSISTSFPFGPLGMLSFFLSALLLECYRSRSLPELSPEATTGDYSPPGAD